jgi:hypothetical protein
LYNNKAVKNKLTGLIIMLLFSTILAACGSLPKPVVISGLAQTTPDPDVAALLKMNEQALILARKKAPDAVLHQIDTDLHWTDFRFTDGVATKEITVIVPSPDTPIGQWQVEVPDLSKLTGNRAPGIDLKTLKIGPGQVGKAAKIQWPGCTLHSLTLFIENGELTWVAFCATPGGDVSGFMKNDDGIFRSYADAPFQVPVTATPRP